MALGVLPQNISDTHSRLNSFLLFAGSYAGRSNQLLGQSLLLPVYAATELYMLTDLSPGRELTWQLL
jgi:hypothetical protein